MAANLGDLAARVAVARAGGFRDAARATDSSASSLSEAVRRLEARLGVRLFHRTTRSVTPTEAGARLLDRLGPALVEVEAALDVVNGFRDQPTGTLRLNVPVSAVRLVLPRIVPPFLAAYPDIRLDIVADDSFVDMLAAGCDAGIRYDDWLEQDMIAIPHRSPRTALRDGGIARLPRSSRPPRASARVARPRMSARPVQQRCDAGLGVRTRRPGREGRPAGPLIVRVGAATDLAVDAAIAGSGVIHLFEDWLRPFLDNGALEPALTPWWRPFSGPFLYFPGRRYLPAPLRAFVDFIGSQRP